MKKMKTVEEIMRGVAEIDNEESRNTRRNMLNVLKSRVEDWIAAVDERGKGPSAELMTTIIYDLKSLLKDMESYETTNKLLY